MRSNWIKKSAHIFSRLSCCLSVNKGIWTASVVYWLVCSSTLDRVIDPRSGQIKEYNIGICCFSAKNTIFGWLVGWLVGCMMINATFNNISAISWRSVLLVEETEYPEKTTDLSQVTDTLYHIMLYRVLLACSGFELTTLVEIEGNYKSNYHTTTTTTAPAVFGSKSKYW